MHSATLSTRKNVGVSFKQNENRETMPVTNLSLVISNKMRTEKPCLLLIWLQLFNLQGSFDIDILAKEKSYVFAKFACYIYRNDLVFYFQDGQDRPVRKRSFRVCKPQGTFLWPSVASDMTISGGFKPPARRMFLTFPEANTSDLKPLFDAIGPVHISYFIFLFSN